MNEENFTVREARADDIPFVIEGIIEANKSGTDTLYYTTVFDLNETQLKEILTNCLLEGLDGSDFSLSSYLLGFAGDAPAAVWGSWIEGEGGESSSGIRSSLISYYFPKESIVKAFERAGVISALSIKESAGTGQFGICYVKKEYRGKGLASLMARKSIERMKRAGGGALKQIEVQIMNCNDASLKFHEKEGFKIVLKKASEHPDIKLYYPGNQKYLLQKNL